MPKIVGRNVSVGFGKETTRGTPATTFKWVAKTGLSYDEKMETLVDETAVGSIVDSIGHSIVKQWSEGEVTGNLAVNSIVFPLLSLFGTVSSATDSAGAYIHTYTLSNSNTSPSLTVAMDDAVQDYSFPLAVVRKITFKIEPQKFVEVSIDLIGKKGQTATHTATFATDYTLKASNSSIVFASNLAGLASATSSACMKNFEITLEKTTTEDVCIQTLDPVDYISTVFAISGSMEVTYENVADYRTKALNGTYQAMRIAIEDGSTVIGASSSPTLEIDLAKVGFTEWSRTISNTEIVTQSVGFKGFYSIADSQAVVLRLVNTTATI